jgi:hypothetical protein
MRKIDFFKTLFTVCIFLFGTYAANANEPLSTVLAHWTFEKWLGVADQYPEGQEADKPIAPDAGTFVNTALFGVSSQFPDSGDTTAATWSTPTTAGYVRTSGMDVGGFYRITGLFAEGFGPIRVMARVGTSSSGRHYEMMIQYRTSATGTWIDASESIRVESTSQSNMPIVFDHVEMPWGINNQSVIELRFLMTANYSPEGSTPQTRFQEILITADAYTNVGELQMENIRVFNNAGRLSIRNAGGSDVEVYSITGAKVMEIQNVNDIEGVALPTGQLYIVRIDNQAFKVVF